MHTDDDGEVGLDGNDTSRTLLGVERALVGTDTGVAHAVDGDTVGEDRALVVTDKALEDSFSFSGLQAETSAEGPRSGLASVDTKDNSL